MGEFVRIEDSGTDKVAIIRLDRPKVNALSKQVGLELLEAAKTLAGRDDVRGVVVYGGERFFAAGADIAEFPIEGDVRDPSPMVDPLNDAIFAIENLPQITVAAVNGFALGGGCELSMSTDFRICGENAKFGQPEILLGIIPGAGGTQRLTRLVGVTKSKELNYSGRMVDADEALTIGLVSAVHPDGDVLEKAIEMAASFANGPAALRNAKKAIMDGLHVSLEEAIAIEKREFAAAFQTDDAVIGITSFLANGPGKAEFSGT
jgi:enoyl-CoA hydratase/carnithine racemase